MEHLNTPNLNLEVNGWELLINDQGNVFEARPGNVVKIVIVTLSPLDFDIREPVRSVSHTPLWVEIEKYHRDGFIGTLKTKPDHVAKIKDGTEFHVGDKIFFTARNILAIRLLHHL